MFSFDPDPLMQTRRQFLGRASQGVGALDPMVRAELQRDLREVFRTVEKTVVLVTHDLAEARHFGARVVLMRAGTIVQRGTIETLERDPVEPFVTAFLRAQQPAENA